MIISHIFFCFYSSLLFPSFFVVIAHWVGALTRKSNRTEAEDEEEKKSSNYDDDKVE